MLLVGALTMPAFGQNRIGTIDLQKVFQNYWMRTKAESALKERGTAMDKELKGFVDDYNKTKEEYTKLITTSQDQSKTQEERDKSKTSAESKSCWNSRRAKIPSAPTKRTRKTSWIRRRRGCARACCRTSRGAINAKAKASGYTLVIDTSADSFNQTPTVLYSNGENDMTDMILKQLNAGAPAEAPKGTTDKPA